MKTILSFVFGLVVSFSFAQTTPVAPDQPGAPKSTQKLKFESTVKDFGEIPQKVPASFEFKCVNVSNEPIIISDVVKSCGCTQPEFSKEPILPGKSSVVKATYNAAGIGPFNKTLTVKTSTGDVVILTVKGKVIAPPPAATN